MNGFDCKITMALQIYIKMFTCTVEEFIGNVSDLNGQLNNSISEQFQWIARGYKFSYFSVFKRYSMEVECDVKPMELTPQPHPS